MFHAAGRSRCDLNACPRLDRHGVRTPGPRVAATSALSLVWTRAGDQLMFSHTVVLGDPPPPDSAAVMDHLPCLLSDCKTSPRRLHAADGLGRLRRAIPGHGEAFCWACSTQCYRGIGKSIVAAHIQHGGEPRSHGVDGLSANWRNREKTSFPASSVSYLTKVRLHGRSSVRLPTPRVPSKRASTR